MGKARILNWKAAGCSCSRVAPSKEKGEETANLTASAFGGCINPLHVFPEAQAYATGLDIAHGHISSAWGDTFAAQLNSATARAELDLPAVRTQAPQ